MFSTEEMKKARKVPLVYVCREKGIELAIEKAGKGKFGLGEWRVKGGNGLCICDNYYYWFGSPLGNGILNGQEGNSSNTLTFCTEYLNMRFKEAMQFLLSLADNDFSPSAVANKALEKQSANEIITPKKAPNNSKIINYLTVERGLKKEVILDLIDKGYLYQEQNKNNCVFVCKNFSNNNEVMGYEIKGILKDKRYYRNYGSALFFISKGNPISLTVFESAIDLLSFYQFYNKWKDDNFLLCSMGGVAKYKLVREIALSFKNKNGSCSVKIATDNDVAGENFYEEFLSKNQDLKIFRRKPIYENENAHLNKSFKDWNELLKWWIEEKKRRE